MFESINSSFSKRDGGIQNQGRVQTDIYTIAPFSSPWHHSLKCVSSNHTSIALPSARKI